MSGTSTWHPEMNERLCELRGGGMSFGQISATLNRSRCALIGRYSRMLDEPAKLLESKRRDFADLIADGYPVEVAGLMVGLSANGANALFCKMRLELGPQAI